MRVVFSTSRHFVPQRVAFPQWYRCTADQRGKEDPSAVAEFTLVATRYPVQIASVLLRGRSGMGWECSSLASPTMAALLLHGLTSSSSRCPSSRLSYTSTPLRPDGIPRRRVTVGARVDDSPDGSQQQLNFSVLRFTLGIPGLDESYLPRYLGLAFGSLIVLNHFLGSSDFPTPAQLRSEALGICLAGFSTALPYFGNFLKGASPVDRSFLPEGNTQIFAMSEDFTDLYKEDLAWGSYVLLRNTNTSSVLISVGDALCIRGYWDLPEDSSKALVLDSFRRQIQQTGLIDLKDTLYFPQGVASQDHELVS